MAKLVKENQKLRKLRTKTSLNDVIFVSMSTVLHDLFNFFKQQKKSGKPLFFYPTTGIHCPIVHPLPLFIEHWYFNITLCMDTCITILDCVVFCCHSPVFPPPLIFYFKQKLSLFRLLIASLSPSLYSHLDDHVFSDGHECVSRSRQDLRGSVDTNNAHLTIVAVSF